MTPKGPLSLSIPMFIDKTILVFLSNLLYIPTPHNQPMFSFSKLDIETR